MQQTKYALFCLIILFFNSNIQAQIVNTGSGSSAEPANNLNSVSENTITSTATIQNVNATENTDPYSVNNEFTPKSGSILTKPNAKGYYPLGYFSQTTFKQLSDDEKYTFARQMAQEYPIIDGHVDLPYRLVTKNFRLSKEFIDIPVESEEGDFDFVRAKKGGLDVPIMSIYIPASHQEDGTAKVFADSLINMVQGIIKAHPARFGAVERPYDITRNRRKGLVSLAMGMENGAPIMDSIENVKHFYDRGVRYITLTHSKDNQICDSSYDTTATWGGLSPFGEQVVKEMNRIGMLVDISHVSDSTFYDVMEIVDVPVIASHSSVRKFTPDFERNMNDEMLELLAENGGVIMINFGSTFLDGGLREQMEEKRAELIALLQEKELSPTDEEAKPIIEEFRKENFSLHADVELVVDHIDHVVELVGIDHVGLGSDFDGVGDTLPRGLENVEDYPNLVAALLKRGYEARDIRKICSGNFLRVWKRANEIAKMKQNDERMRKEIPNMKKN